MKRRQGFTLIELLIVIVIIGILAAIAIPKFSKTREKAFVKAMQSDLRNLANQEELYYSEPSNGYEYGDQAAMIPSLFTASQGVTVTITRCRRNRLVGQRCTRVYAEHVCDLSRIVGRCGTGDHTRHSDLHEPLTLVVLREASIGLPRDYFGLL